MIMMKIFLLILLNQFLIAENYSLDISMHEHEQYFHASLLEEKINVEKTYEIKFTSIPKKKSAQYLPPLAACVKSRSDDKIVYIIFIADVTSNFQRINRIKITSKAPEEMFCKKTNKIGYFQSYLGFKKTKIDALYNQHFEKISNFQEEGKNKEIYYGVDFSFRNDRVESYTFYKGIEVLN